MSMARRSLSTALCQTSGSLSATFSGDGELPRLKSSRCFSRRRSGSIRAAVTSASAVVAACIFLIQALYFKIVSAITKDGLLYKQFFALVCWSSMPILLSYLAQIVGLVISDVSLLPATENLLRLVAAALFGLLLGVDRELKDKPAGVRSYMLVSIGAAGFAILTLELPASLESAQIDFTLDPSRAIQGLIGGIGFLGAGAIIRRNGGVQGVATGAAIWLSGAIGMACGFGNYGLAVSMTAIALFVLVIVGFFRRHPPLESED